MQQDNTTQKRNDRQNWTPIRIEGQQAQHRAAFEDVDSDESERQLAGGEVDEQEVAWHPGDDPSDEHPPEQHLHFPISLADWGPRNSLL